MTSNVVFSNSNRLKFTVYVYPHDNRYFRLNATSHYGYSDAQQKHQQHIINEDEPYICTFFNNKHKIKSIVIAHYSHFFFILFKMPFHATACAPLKNDYPLMSVPYKKLFTCFDTEWNCAPARPIRTTTKKKRAQFCESVKCQLK